MTQQFNRHTVIQDPIERYLNGDYHVCGQLLCHPEYRQTVARIARKNTRGTSVSWEDAAQTAHTKVFQAAKAGNFRRGGITQFYRWAATVARFAIIDLVRRQKQQHCLSLDQNIPGTDLPLLETIADEFDLLDTVERTDLVTKAIETISALQRRYPNRGYQKLWQGKVQGKTQVQLAADLGLTQSAISKRWQELSKRLAQELGLLQTEDLEREMNAKPEQKTLRLRSEQQW
ncbi:MAG TPA: sigma-70 family RNA polymerase sigma factor [Cyanobacteria bacterium UBA11162]|nr:sigma-70 family RNA polymerase sigma factor [Cyanobacteria bacterium UBA11162]